MSETYSPAGNVSAQTFKRATAGEAATGTFGDEFMRQDMTQIADRIRSLKDDGSVLAALMGTFAAGLRSAAGMSGTLASGVAGTVITLPPTEGLYLFFMSYAEDPGNYGSYAIIAVSSSAQRLLVAGNAGMLVITLAAGRAVQATQASGLPGAIFYSYVFMPLV